MKRRDFIKATGAGAGFTAAGGFIPSLVQAAERLPKPDDFEILEKCDDVESLEKLLIGGESAIPLWDHVPNITFNFPRNLLPSIIYDYTSEIIQSRKYCELLLDKIGVGSGLILTNKGHFISAHHVLERVIKGERDTVLLYNPAADIIRKITPLAYTEKYDLALGKIDVPDDFKVNPVFISKGTVREGSFVFSIMFDNKIISSPRVINEVMDSCEIDFECDGSVYSPMQTRTPNLTIDSLIPTYLEKATIIPLMDGEPYFKEGCFFAIGKDRHGNSGTFMFDVYHNIVGVLSGGLECFPCDKNEVVHEYTSNEKIRELITKYFAACTGRQPRTELSPEEKEARKYKERIIEKPIPIKIF